MKNTEIIEALNWRYATKVFDTTKKVSEEDLGTILEAARLAPSSYGIEAWKFIVVTNPEIRTQLRAAGYDQAQITDASHLVVVTARTDAAVIPGELIARTAATHSKTVEELAGYQQMVAGAIANRSAEVVQAWFNAQTYIALGMMVEAAALLNIDAGPMEGFDAGKVNEILGLSAKNLTAVSFLALGYRAADATPKTRRTREEVIEIVA